MITLIEPLAGVCGGRDERGARHRKQTSLLRRKWNRFTGDCGLGRSEAREKMGKLKYFALRVTGGRPAETLEGLVVWIGILFVPASLYFWPSLFRLSLVALVLIFLGALYFRAINESDHLVYFIGYLLLLDGTRAIHKQSFEDLLRQSHAKDASTLSKEAMRAIQHLSERLAAGDPKKPEIPSTVLGFRSLVWDRKLGRV
jgi:hypothetical protein